MNDFIIHSIPGSPYGRAALVALEEKGARYRLSPIAPGSLKTPEHLSKHPFGKVPALEHGTFGYLKRRQSCVTWTGCCRNIRLRRPTYVQPHVWIN